MNESYIPAIAQTITIMTPLLLAATGGLFSALAGVLNIALEGLMLCSAFFSVVFTVASGNLFVGILAGILATLLLTALFAFISLGLRANIFISGLATNLLAAGLSIVLSYAIYGQTGSVSFPDMPRLNSIVVPWISDIPILGDIFSGQNILVYISWILLIIASVVIYRTPFGMRLRAVGHDMEAARSVGINPKMIQFIAILISGFTCALAGAMLTLTLGAFVPNVTSGRGWIALVIIYLGNRTPVGVLIGAIIFGLVEYLSNFLQAVSNLPSGLLLAMPFFVTVLALVLYSILERQLRIRRRTASANASRNLPAEDSDAMSPASALEGSEGRAEENGR